MNDSHHHADRRSFIKKIGGTAAALATLPHAFAAQHTHILKRRNSISANDRINVACIGMGLMGFGDVRAALAHPGVEFIAAADCYQGHLDKTKADYGQGVMTTMDYREVLDMPEVDAVIIATPDHWHDIIAKEAMCKGKAVYLEKPMVQHLNEGQEVISVYKETKVPFQVGSQFASSIVFQKAKALYESGEIGKLNFAEVYFDRFSALGAWQYSIPPDASPKTCNWEMFQGDASDMPFDPLRFFRWRNYRDYGTGVAGDLFVHLFTMLHTITSSFGPERIYTTGGLRYWQDGRDVSDVMIGLFDYPETETHPAFNLSLRVNFVDGSGGGQQTRLVGDEGEMVLDPSQITIRKKRLPQAPGYGGWDTYEVFPDEMKQEFVRRYDQMYGYQKPQIVPPKELTFRAPEGYDMRVDHLADWLNVIRHGGETVEGPEFGMRAAGPALASNVSHYQNKIVYWDPLNMRALDS
jgi:predicted dehydrogenase